MALFRATAAHSLVWIVPGYLGHPADGPRVSDETIVPFLLLDAQPVEMARGTTDRFGPK